MIHEWFQAAGCTTLTSQQPDPDPLHVHGQLGRRIRRRDVQRRLQQPDPDQLHVHGQLGRRAVRRRDVQRRLQQPDPDRLHVHGQLGRGRRRRDVQHNDVSNPDADCTFRVREHSADHDRRDVQLRRQQPGNCIRLHVHEQLGRRRRRDAQLHLPPALTGCSFMDNVDTVCGGDMYNDGSDPCPETGTYDCSELGRPSTAAGCSNAGG